MFLLTASSSAVGSYSEMAGRIKKHNLDPRRALWGITECPDHFYQDGDACCAEGTGFCCNMNGERCFCKQGQLKQGIREEPNGCGSTVFEKSSGISLATQQKTFFEMDAACRSHDKCYTDCTRSHKECDDEYLRLAHEACANRYWNPLSWEFWADMFLWFNGGKAQCHTKAGLSWGVMADSPAWLESMSESCRCEEDKPLRWRYKGCYVDDSERNFKVFKGRVTGFLKVINECMKKCSDYDYFALQHFHSDSAECYCSPVLNSNPNRYAKVDDGQCEIDYISFAVGSFHMEMLGRGWRNAVFEIY